MRTGRHYRQVGNGERGGSARRCVDLPRILYCKDTGQRGGSPKRAFSRTSEVGTRDRLRLDAIAVIEMTGWIGIRIVLEGIGLGSSWVAERLEKRKENVGMWKGRNLCMTGKEGYTDTGNRCKDGEKQVKERRERRRKEVGKVLNRYILPCRIPSARSYYYQILRNYTESPSAILHGNRPLDFPGNPCRHPCQPLFSATQKRPIALPRFRLIKTFLF